MRFSDRITWLSRAAHPADQPTKNQKKNQTETENGSPDNLTYTADAYRWMRGIDPDVVESIATRNPHYDRLDQVINCRAKRGEIPELISGIAGMFDIIESAIGSEHQAKIKLKGKKLRVAAMTIFGLTIISGSLCNVTPWVMSAGTRVCLLSGMALLLGLYGYGRRVEIGAEAERNGTYPLRKAEYIQRYMAHLGFRVEIEKTEPTTK